MATRTNRQKYVDHAKRMNGEEIEEQEKIDFEEFVKTAEGEALDIEKTIHTTGGWYRQKGNVTQAHYFISRHPKAQIALSLCGQVVSLIEHLRPSDEMKQCLVCGLFHDARKEREQAEKVYKTQVPQAGQEPDQEPIQPNQTKLFEE